VDFGPSDTVGEMSLDALLYMMGNSSEPVRSVIVVGAGVSERIWRDGDGESRCTGVEGDEDSCKGGSICLEDVVTSRCMEVNRGES
jgi:hypothetical protein